MIRRGPLLAVLLTASVLIGQSVAGVTVVKTSTKKSKIIDLTDDNFDNEISKGPILVKVYADWCSHCRALVPVWEELAEELEGEVALGQVNGPTQKALQTRLSVRGYPALYLFRDGRTWEYSGSRGAAQLAQFARYGWQSAEPLPFYKSPNGLIGRALGLISRVPVRLEKLYHVLHDDMGHSNLAILGGTLMFPLIFGIIFICCIDTISVHQQRHAPAHAHAE